MGDAMRIRGLGGSRGGGLLRSCGKNDLQEPEKFVDLRAGNQEGRQQAQRKIVSAIDEQSALHGLADKRPAFNGKFDADHQAFGTYFADKTEFGGELGEAVAQLRA